MSCKVVCLQVSKFTGMGFPAFLTSLLADLKNQWPHVAYLEWHQFLTPSFSFESYDVILLPDACFTAEMKPDMVILAVNPTVPDVEGGLVAKNEWMSHGISKTQLLTCMMDDGFPGALSKSVVSEHMGGIDIALPFDPRVSLRALHKNIPITDVRRKSPLAHAIKNLSALVTNRLLHPPTTSDEPAFQNLDVVEHEVMRAVWNESEGSTESLDLLVARHLGRVLTAGGIHLIPSERQVLQNKIIHRTKGLGPLEQWMSNDQVNEIMVSGTEPLCVEREGRLQRTNDRFVNLVQLQVVIDRIVRESGRRVDTSSPMCDVRLRDGSRVNVVLPPIAVDGPSVTIRRFRRQFLSLDDLVKAGTLSEHQVSCLIQCVKRKTNLVIAGNSGSGKTTLLNLLSAFIDTSERIITLEDAAELRLQQPHVVRLETRKPNLEGAGEVTMVDLVVNALRMRPDRLIVGECRGAEAVPMLQAMNTGHHGSMTTLHANSAQDALRRLESMVLLGAPQWPVAVARQQIKSAVGAIVYLERSHEKRTVKEMATLELENGELNVVAMEIHS